jgi:hypothetical protein
VTRRNDPRFAPAAQPIVRKPVRGTPEALAEINTERGARGLSLWTMERYAAHCAEFDRAATFEPAIECPWD